MSYCNDFYTAEESLYERNASFLGMSTFPTPAVFQVPRQAERNRDKTAQGFTSKRLLPLGQFDHRFTSRLKKSVILPHLRSRLSILGVG